MTYHVLTKTAKGREEIATRNHHLPGATRRLLALIDGKHSRDELVCLYGGIGLTDAVIDELLARGFAAMVELAPPLPQDASEARFRAAHAFYEETICNVLGLAGLALRRKLLRASHMDDLRALRSEYLEAVFHSKGYDIAVGLRGRLDEVLGEPRPNTVSTHLF